MSCLTICNNDWSKTFACIKKVSLFWGGDKSVLRIILKWKIAGGEEFKPQLLVARTALLRSQDFVEQI